ncbi:hypothetical protein CCP3SC15_580010 [Gammaproteobacteria bacterium]
MTARQPGSLRVVRGGLSKLGLHKHHPFYMAWVNMKTRCDNPKSTQYPWYGARGITYCEEWKSFEVFHQDMFEDWRYEWTLDRIDTNGNYSYLNCRWVPVSLQAKNRRPRGVQ